MVRAYAPTTSPASTPDQYVPFQAILSGNAWARSGRHYVAIFPCEAMQPDDHPRALGRPACDPYSGPRSATVVAAITFSASTAASVAPSGGSAGTTNFGHQPSGRRQLQRHLLITIWPRHPTPLLRHGPEASRGEINQSTLQVRSGTNLGAATTIPAATGTVSRETYDQVAGY